MLFPGRAKGRTLPLLVRTMTAGLHLSVAMHKSQYTQLFTLSHRWFFDEVAKWVQTLLMLSSGEFHHCGKV